MFIFIGKEFGYLFEGFSNCPNDKKSVLFLHNYKGVCLKFTICVR